MTSYHSAACENSDETLGKCHPWGREAEEQRYGEECRGGRDRARQGSHRETHMTTTPYRHNSTRHRPPHPPASPPRPQHRHTIFNNPRVKNNKNYLFPKINKCAKLKQNRHSHSFPLHFIPSPHFGFPPDASARTMQRRGRRRRRDEKWDEENPVNCVF